MRVAMRAMLLLVHTVSTVCPSVISDWSDFGSSVLQAGGTVRGICVIRGGSRDGKLRLGVRERVAMIVLIGMCVRRGRNPERDSVQEGELMKINGRIVHLGNVGVILVALTRSVRKGKGGNSWTVGQAETTALGVCCAA